MKRIFISKEESELRSHADWFKSAGFTLEAHTFLEFKKVYRELTASFEILFFNSPRAVIFFMAQHAIPAGTALACAGSKTAEILSTTGRTALFVGENSGDMTSVAARFKEWCGERKVLFPVSTRSLGTVSSVFSEDQGSILEVYETKITGKTIPAQDVYVFTSPSNAEGFLLDNQIPKDAHVIAWGKSTEKYLLERDISPTHTLADSSMEGLKKYLSDLA